MANRSLRKIVNKWSRRVHRWGAIAVMLPLGVVIVTGLLLLLKKELAWIQPPGRKGASARVDATSPEGMGPTISFARILEAAQQARQAGIAGWSDIDRLDVRIDDGMVKVHSRSHWEVQVDTLTGTVLQVAPRRSDLIESLHDGSWFHPGAKLWVFLPNGLILLSLWATGIYLWILPYLARRRARRRGRGAEA